MRQLAREQDPFLLCPTDTMRSEAPLKNTNALGHHGTSGATIMYQSGAMVDTATVTMNESNFFIVTHL